MNLKNKVMKVRDLFVYNTNILPLNIDIKRDKIIITVRQSDLQREGFTGDGVIKHIAKITGRHITLSIEEDGYYENTL